MSTWRLIFRGLVFYWRTHLAMMLGVATAVAVLAGALLVGESVRISLRALVLERIGQTDDVIVSPRFFTESLVTALQRDPQFSGTFDGLAPLIAARGVVTSQESGRRAGDVLVYGVDDRFWQFHRIARSGPRGRAAYVSRALAEQLQVQAGGTLLVRVQRVSDVPIETLHGRKEDVGRTLRVTAASVLSREDLGEFSLEPAQRDVRAVFVPLQQLQEEIEASGRVNTVLVARRPAVTAAHERLVQLVRRQATLADAGITVTPVEASHTLVIGATGGLLDDREADAATRALARAGVPARPVFTYLANGLRVGDRDVPYSLVSALDLQTIAPGVTADADAIVLNTWAASDLRARVGDALTMDFYAWEEPGRLVTRSATFTVAGVVPIAAGSRDLAPTFPGITDSPTLDDWDPPFPLDLHRVRRVDEDYWNKYRTTPKAYIQIDAGRRLWRSRYGALTSLRAPLPAGERLAVAAARVTSALRDSFDPLASGLAVRDVRGTGLEASKGATDFGEYFVYFSFFLVVSALLLASLFFKLGVEQRVREVGLLRAVGFAPAAVRRLFLAEGLALSVAGSGLGVVAGVGYAALLMLGLRTWWVDAVGTTALTLHVTAMPLVAGAAGGVLAAVICVWWTLRMLARVTERSLLSGDLVPAAEDGGRRGRALPIAAGSAGLTGAGLLLAGATGVLAATPAFFGAGVAFMTAALGFFLWRLRQRPRRALARPGWRGLSHLGVRYAGYRASRSVLSAAVIACATFILIAVGAFRQDATTDRGRQSGLGGYSLIVDTLLPLVHDPNTPEGRAMLNLPALGRDVRIAPFRVRAGDDASCLNLYQPASPRVVAPPDGFLEEGRFAFARSLAATDAERANPWLLLRRQFPDGAVPVIADANSMTYVLHRALGDEIVMPGGERPVRLRLVAALHDSIFQGELVMSSGNFVRLFPEVEGYQRLLVESPAGAAAPLSEAMADALVDAGANVETTWGRLAQFHRVENTYLSTFQTLGALGLLLGTVGLGAVLLRNALERRRELALLGAVGYRRGHVLLLIVAENALLLAAGAGTGAVAAALAIAPAVAERGGRLPLTAGAALLLFAVVATGLLSSIVAIRAATRGPLLSSLRSE